MQSASQTIPFEVFTRLRDFIREKLGIHFGDNKAAFLEKRVLQRLQFLDISSFKEYYHHLRYADRDGFELQALTDLITTNETYMFREFEQLEAFANSCLPEVYEKKRKQGDATLRIWSAGCSTGEEPYTLAIILMEVLDDYREFEIEIVATDVDTRALERAKTGYYLDRSVKHVPKDYYGRHLQFNGKEHTVLPDTRKLVRFEHLNLSDRRAMRRHRGYDFIFCRNVLIYFDELARKNVVDHFYVALNRDGYVFLGHSESIGRISNAFHLKKMNNHLVYSKS
ncbi:protein-glutamate O-methyltransferase CheR [Pelagicoccus sp. SDUM812003]|uniref:CheR family methyltransferase n=1 Tax=Pelagicoccus sp. SDUM812003 TaxID=3041267 RepID=UPI00280EC922|nr:protein-glutamate O-methyltransferase CheR [Pelagicoccus sp. SDUM812003]MDQ8204708.1 protein-glutamate O-methyltransferase CheR [Pelagicoccus sp. SDUM812003]